jgi:hypothetical protein
MAGKTWGLLMNFENSFHSLRSGVSKVALIAGMAAPMLLINLGHEDGPRMAFA